MKAKELLVSAGSLLLAGLILVVAGMPWLPPRPQTPQRSNRR